MRVVAGAAAVGGADVVRARTKSSVTGMFPTVTSTVYSRQTVYIYSHTYIDIARWVMLIKKNIHTQSKLCLITGIYIAHVLKYHSC